MPVTIARDGRVIMTMMSYIDMLPVLYMWTVATCNHSVRACFLCAWEQVCAATVQDDNKDVR